MNIKKILSALAVIILLLLWSCIREPYAGELTSEKVTVQLGARALQGGVLEGVKIDKVRLLLFDKNGGLVLNSTTSNGTLVENAQEQFVIDVETGTYAFAIIINETPELTAQINAVNSQLELKQTKTAWTINTFTDENIPLVNYGTLEIFAGLTPGQGVGRVTEYDASSPNTIDPTSPVSISMPRALSKISLFMRRGDAVTDAVVINRVEVVNLPLHWYINRQVADETGSAPLFIGTKTVESSTGETEHDGKKYHSFQSSGCIIPEKYFEASSDYQNEANAAYLVITATFGGVPTTYKVLLRDKDADFRLLRNTNYNVYISVTGIGAKGIYVLIEPAKMYNITVNWKPVEGLVVVSDREADFNKNINVWADYSVYSGVLKVYKGDVYNDVLFKYGSLMAIENDMQATTEQDFVPPTDATITNDVMWFPGGFTVTNITDWATIPYISDGSSVSLGNTVDMVRAGKGDPCRLAALSPEQIQFEGRIDNQQWHMATPTEYALLMKAANGAGSENDNGYRSFHELLVPNVKYRDTTGKLTASHNFGGRYWSVEANKAFVFDSKNPTASTFKEDTPQQGYTVRCVRNSIPPPDISFSNTNLVFDYKGSEVNGFPFGITSNVPYWKIELIKSGGDKGSSNDFNDFSFAPFTADPAGVQHVVEGGYSAVPHVYVKRRESRTEDRTFKMRFTSIHFDGTETTYDFTVAQRKYDIRGLLNVVDGLDSNKWFPVAANKYTLKITLAPNDVSMPVGAKLKVTYWYHNTLRGTSTETITTAANQYEYEVTMDVQANGTVDVIGLNFKIFMDEKADGNYVNIGNADYYQNNK